VCGSKLVAKLSADGHEAVAASSHSGVNTLTGEGLNLLTYEAAARVGLATHVVEKEKALITLVK
jgi:hypothetical protein